MATAKWGTPTGLLPSAAAILTTQLNALTNGSMANSSTTAVDNATAKNLYADIWVSLDSFTPSATPPYVDILFFYSHDGTNYEDQSSARLDKVVASPMMTTGTGGKGMVVVNIPIAPYKFYVALVNRTGATLAATNNSVLVRTHSGDVS
jgi:hypothetical protein